ncbi:unnamed protein product, partial [Ixodes hexagonus]
VGGGSAGALLANRLSSRPELRVLLIEAGAVENTLTDVPLMATLNLRGPLDWDYWTEPQRNACLALKDKKSPWPRGKVLGGCSAINFMLYVRGNAQDYDLWSLNHGAQGWDSESILPFFKKFEAQTNAALAASGDYGTTGEMTLSSAESNTELARAFLAAGKELGYDTIDYNQRQQIGFSVFQTTTHKGARLSSASAFLKPVAGPTGRKNLHVALSSRVTKVVFDGKRATGVQFLRNGISRSVSATREVILSAGVIGSPHLLLLSGVGPKEQLREFKIPVVADLAGVGENLMEHVYAGGVSATVSRKLDIDITPFAGPLLYYTQNKGPWTIPGGVETVAFVKTEVANKSLNVPDVEIVLFSMSPASEEGERFMLDIGLDPGASFSVYNEYYLPLRDTHGYNLAPILLHPKSRGVLRLRSANPEDPPLIDPRYLSHPDDIKVIVEGIKVAMRIADTESFRALGSKMWPRHFPGCEHHVLWSDTYLECLARQFTTALWHPAGTCKMGVGPQAVVDSRLRVLGGVKNLRVVDASIMPEHVSGHLNAPAMMIGEKAAHMILEDLDAKLRQEALEEVGPPLTAKNSSQ